MVYIHSDSERKLPHNFDAACALYGAIENAQDVRLTSLDEVVSGKFDRLIRKHLFVGSVDFMHTVFNRAGSAIPSLSGLKKDYIVTNLSVVRDKVNGGETWFIKPLEAKVFTGMVFNAATIAQLSPYPADMEVLICKPFEHSIRSETRCYVHHHKIIDARNYAGDFRIAPDWDWAGTILSKASGAPVAYTMDIGVLDNGRNVIIEFNDMWAIGNYGMENSQYFQLLRDRYFEIMSI